jgi:hypothetical protein
MPRFFLSGKLIYGEGGLTLLQQLMPVAALLLKRLGWKDSIRAGMGLASKMARRRAWPLPGPRHRRTRGAGEDD